MMLDRDGAELFAGVLSEVILADLDVALADAPRDRVGVRLFGLPFLHAILGVDGAIGMLAARLLRAECRPVRAVLFDKSPATNWALGWHQDRTIVVQEKCELPGYAVWSVKAGLLHVEPPFELLARMLTVRLHLDDVDLDNAPLLVAPGSHLLGKLPEGQVGHAAVKCGVHACLAKRCDVWACSTPILHASEAARRPTRRRVLQIDFSRDELPPGLCWKGV